MGYHHDSDYKLHAVKHYLKNGNYVETCEIFECKRTSLMGWVKRYKNTETVDNKERPLLSYKVTKEHIKYAKEILKNNKLITLEELNKKLKNKFDDYDITARWLGKLLKDNFITRKRTRRKHFPDTRFGKDINYKDEVKRFFDKIKKYNMKDIISIDETSIRANIIPEYCRSQKGRRCYYESKDNKIFRKYTLIVAISMKGLIGFKLYEKGGINAERYLDFINEFILSKYKNKLLLFDNARAHTATSVLDEIKKSKNDYLIKSFKRINKYNNIKNKLEELSYTNLNTMMDYETISILHHLH